MVLCCARKCSANMFADKEKQKQEVSAHANDANKHIDWLIFFIETMIGPGLDRLSCQMNSRNPPNLVIRALSPGFGGGKAREKRPGDEVGNAPLDQN